MCITPVEIPAVARARWLAELADALEQAQRLLNRVKVEGGRDVLIEELDVWILGARLQVRSLQTSRPARAETDPEWTGFAPWNPGPTDP